MVSENRVLSEEKKNQVKDTTTCGGILDLAERPDGGELAPCYCLVISLTMHLRTVACIKTKDHDHALTPLFVSFFRFYLLTENLGRFHGRKAA
jgi:hypothetical protein